MQAHVRGWKAGIGHAFEHVKSGNHAGSRIAEVEHHPVAQPLDGLARVAD